MPENEKKENLTHKEPTTQFITVPSKDGPLYFQVYVLCVGIQTKDTNELSTSQSFPANEKVSISMMGTHRTAFYLKSNTAFPARSKCIGIQLVMTSVNVNTRELNEQDREKYELAFEMSKSLLPPFSGIRAKFIQDIKSSSEDGVTPAVPGKKKIETLTPFTAPLYLYKKTGEIINTYRDPTGHFDMKGG
eukprot:TRINITY_DN734_c0_g4_i1.p1 TRINITY_DN734_c0_g4~~TRINITY_DN734_c0_g4_i1.p1  ORF type:complete len:190 (+),score=50.70 TRINITY_DN734_c0_g4_i1:58-627(+)